MKLYHGATHKVKKPEISKGRINTDFGRGFYTTTSLGQAKKWAVIKKERSKEPDVAQAVVSVFEVDDDIIYKNYKVRLFNGPTTEWLEFVVNNRRGKSIEEYDLVMGPVANDKLYATLLLYEQGILSSTAAIEQLKTHTLFDQLSFHSEKAIKEIRFLGTVEVEE